MKKKPEPRPHPDKSEKPAPSRKAEDVFRALWPKDRPPISVQDFPVPTRPTRPCKGS
jgi:hypothetical protein